MVLSADFVPIFNGRIKIKVIGMVASQFQWELKPQNNPTPTVCADFCADFLQQNHPCSKSGPGTTATKTCRVQTTEVNDCSAGLFPGLWMTLGHFKDSAATALPLKNTTELNSITLHHWCQASAVKLRQTDVKLASSTPKSAKSWNIEYLWFSKHLSRGRTVHHGRTERWSSRDIPVPEGATWRAPPQRLARTKAKCERRSA